MADFYEVRFTVEIPETATHAEVEAWLRFCLRDTSSMRVDNPLSRHEVEPLRGTFRAFPSAGFPARPMSGDDQANAGVLVDAATSNKPVTGD